MRIRYGSTFGRELDAEVEYLVDRGELQWIRRLRDDLDTIARLLLRFPDVGRELGRQDQTTLRKLKLQRCPFVLWYLSDPASEEVVFFRLFHSRQATPEPRLP